MANKSILEEFTQGFGDAVADMRQKVVEEPMWGRAVTDREAPQWPESKEPGPGFGSSTHVHDKAPETKLTAKAQQSRDGQETILECLACLAEAEKHVSATANLHEGEAFWEESLRMMFNHSKSILEGAACLSSKT